MGLRQAGLRENIELCASNQVQFSLLVLCPEIQDEC